MPFKGFLLSFLIFTIFAVLPLRWLQIQAKKRCRRNFYEKIFESLPKQCFQNGIMSERGKNNRLAGTEGGDLRLDLTSSQKQTIRHQFDCFCKKILREEKVDFQRKMSSQMNREILFCEMSQKQIDELRVTDKYPSDMNIFTVLNFEIGVENDLLAEALKNLSSTNRDIVLLSYFMDLSDTEIAEMLSIVRRTVQYRRKSSLNKLKKHMEESE